MKADRYSKQVIWKHCNFFGNTCKLLYSMHTYGANSRFHTNKSYNESAERKKSKSVWVQWTLEKIHLSKFKEEYVINAVVA